MKEFTQVLQRFLHTVMQISGVHYPMCLLVIVVVGVCISESVVAGPNGITLDVERQATWTIGHYQHDHLLSLKETGASVANQVRDYISATYRNKRNRIVNNNTIVDAERYYPIRSLNNDPNACGVRWSLFVNPYYWPSIFLTANCTGFPRPSVNYQCESVSRVYPIKTVQQVANGRFVWNIHDLRTHISVGCQLFRYSPKVVIMG